MGILESSARLLNTFYSVWNEQGLLPEEMDYVLLLLLLLLLFNYLYIIYMIYDRSKCILNPYRTLTTLVKPPFLPPLITLFDPS